MNKVCVNQDQLCNESASAPPNSGLACSQRRLFGLLGLAGLTSLVSGCAGLGSLSSGPSRHGSDLP
ncbi:MAG: hypothetical protein EBT14_02625, partial [Betaproteobacteria bacterium]|nr:hypothetical protein [Betaproteobacteria bacterium]